eukprot:8788225-Alexandrium_andersonii.AAC.1
MKPPGGGQGRQAADAAKELSAASQAADQGQLASESILLQGQPVLGTASQGQASSSSRETKQPREDAAAPSTASLQAGGVQPLLPGAAAPTGARSQLGPGE